MYYLQMEVSEVKTCVTSASEIVMPDPRSSNRIIGAHYYLMKTLERTYILAKDSMSYFILH